MIVEPSSFRDPDSRVVVHNNEIFRIFSKAYKDVHTKFWNSELRQRLVDSRKLVNETEVDPVFFKSLPEGDFSYKIVKPERIEFISYPYEWTFTQFKEASLLTLEIQLLCIEYGYTLKDASAYNIQFKNGLPIFIDTGSFEILNSGEPWKAYGQFCRHFLAPLLLMSYGNTELVQLMKSNIDGIPLELCSELLPGRTKFSPFIYMHIHYHSKLESRYAGNPSVKSARIEISKQRLKAIILHLQGFIQGLNLKNKKTEWVDYYQTCNYNSTNFSLKKDIVEKVLSKTSPKKILDAGCNEGEFSLLASNYSELVVSIDFDFMVVEKLNKTIRKNNKINILPMVVNILNPTPAIGWANEERKSFIKRSSFDSTLALALIHHLVISGGISFKMAARFFAQLTNELIIEFVPKSDEQAQRLLITRKDIFADYTEDNFRNSFGIYFDIKDVFAISNSQRVIYYMTNNGKISE